MLNLQNDNELDQLSREAAEGYSLDQQPDSWSKIQQQLDAEIPAKEKRRRFLLLFLFFLLIGSGLVWLELKQTGNSGEQNIVQTEKQQEPTKATANTATGKEKAGGSGVQNTIQATEQGKVQKNPIQDVAINEPASLKKNIRKRVAPDKTGNNKPAFEETQQPKITSEEFNNTRTDPFAGNKDKDQNRAQDLVTADAKNKNKKLNQPDPDRDAAVQQNPPAVKTEQNKDDVKAESKEEKSKAGEEKQQLTVSQQKKIPAAGSSNSRWSFGLVYAPDISTVKFTHTEPLGNNFGATVNYRLSDKFSLQTGAIYTTKRYKLKGEDYHPPKGYWTNSIKLTAVSGNCSMWDIPVNIRYNIKTKKSSAFFASTGLSTYLMKDEDYLYFYYYNGNPVTRARSYYENRDYLFSVLNISAGYQRKLNKSLSLQVEPFFKQPLKGVGFGNIKLNTSGVYFSLIFNPSRKGK